MCNFNYTNFKAQLLINLSYTKFMKEFFVKTEDNTDIAFNHYDSGRNTVVVIAHGWYMCKDTKPFRKMSEEFFKNFDVITMDFRGHGKSSGRYTFTANEPKDLKAVINYAKKRYSKIALIGFSFGGALSIIHTAQNKDVDCLITVSAPSDFNRMEYHCWKPEAIIPTFQKFDIREKRNVRPGNPLLDKLKPIDLVHEIPAPSLFIAGEKDPIVYPWHAEELYKKAVKLKELKIFKDAFHAEDLYLYYPDKFLKLCNDWLSNSCPQAFIL